MSTHQHSLARGTRIRAETQRSGKLRRILTVILTVAAIVLAAAMISPQNTTLTNLDDSLIGEFDPVGTPNRSAVMPYELPELRPSVPSAAIPDRAYAYPEMRPDAGESVDSARISDRDQRPR